jgi:hypothetical protein
MARLHLAIQHCEGDSEVRTVKVEFEMEVPDLVADWEIEDFVSFHVGATSELKHSNPMAHQDLEAKRGTVSVR